MEYFDEESGPSTSARDRPSAGVDRLDLSGPHLPMPMQDQAPDDKGKMETRVVMRSSAHRSN